MSPNKMYLKKKKERSHPYSRQDFKIATNISLHISPLNSFIKSCVVWKTQIQRSTPVPCHDKALGVSIASLGYTYSIFNRNLLSICYM